MGISNFFILIFNLKNHTLKIILSHHYHPSVIKWCYFLLNEKPIEYKGFFLIINFLLILQGDPMQDFSQISFLDRFAYKNPKKNIKKHGHSVMKVYFFLFFNLNLKNTYYWISHPLLENLLKNFQ